MLSPRFFLIAGLVLGLPASLFPQDMPRWQVLLEAARNQLSAGDLAGAEQTYRTALSEVNADAGDVQFIVTTSLADLYQRQNRMDDLENLYRRGLASQERSYGMSDVRIVHWLRQLTGVLNRRGKYDEAEQLALRAVALGESQPDTHAFDLMASLRSLTNTYRAQGRSGEAAEIDNRIIAMARDRVSDSVVRFGEDHAATAGRITELGRAYGDVGQYHQAERELLRALKIYESSLKDYPELSMSYAAALQQMAELYRFTGRANDSDSLLAQAKKLQSAVLHYERAAAR